MRCAVRHAKKKAADYKDFTDESKTDPCDPRKPVACFA